MQPKLPFNQSERTIMASHNHGRDPKDFFIPTQFITRQEAELLGEDQQLALATCIKGQPYREVLVRINPITRFPVTTDPVKSSLYKAFKQSFAGSHINDYVFAR
jgi:hypothetical protein